MTTEHAKSQNNLKKVLIPIGLICLFVIGALYFIQKEMKGTSGNPNIQLKIGDVLSDMKLTRLEGGTQSVSDLNRDVILLNFWATWCEACMEEMPSLVKLREKYSTKGFEIVGINLDENPNAVAPQVIQKFNIRFPIFKDPEGEIAEKFDVHAIPFTVILDNKMKILWMKSGEYDWNTPQIHSLIEGWLKK